MPFAGMFPITNGVNTMADQLPLITSKNYAGVMCFLRDCQLKPGRDGELRHTTDGTPYVINGGRAPHKQGSTGRVYTEGGAEFFPGVMGLEWVPLTASTLAGFECPEVVQEEASEVPTFTLHTPALSLTSYNNVEVFGCITDADGLVERFEENEHPPGTVPTFWSVALHLVTGGIEDIAALEVMGYNFRDTATHETYCAKGWAPGGFPRDLKVYTSGRVEFSAEVPIDGFSAVMVALLKARGEVGE